MKIINKHIMLLITLFSSQQLLAIDRDSARLCGGYLEDHPPALKVIDSGFASTERIGLVPRYFLLPEQADRPDSGSPEITQFVRFSSGGRFALISHRIFDRSISKKVGHHLSLIDVASGDLVRAFSFGGEGTDPGALLSASVGNTYGDIVALAQNGQHDDFGPFDQIVESIGINDIATTDISPLNLGGIPLRRRFSRQQGLRTSVSAEHSYFFHNTHLCFDGLSKRNRHCGKLTDRRTGEQIIFQDVTAFSSTAINLDLISSNFEMMALPNVDGRKIRLFHFSDLESLFERKNLYLTEAITDSLHLPTLDLDSSVFDLQFGKKSPILVTTTLDTCLVWDLYQRNRIAEIPCPFWSKGASGNIDLAASRERLIHRFKLLESIEAIAVIENGYLNIVSYRTGKSIAKIPQDQSQPLDSIIDSWQDSIAYLRTSEGKIQHIVQSPEDRSHYEILDTQIDIGPLVKGFHGWLKQSFAMVSSEREHYLIVVSVKSDDRTKISTDLHFDIYAYSTRAHVAGRSVPMATNGVFALDPSHTRVFFTRSQHQIGYVNLETLVDEIVHPRYSARN